MHASLKRYARKYQAATTEDGKKKFAELFVQEYQKYGGHIPDTHERIHTLATMLNGTTDEVMEQLSTIITDSGNDALMQEEPQFVSITDQLYAAPQPNEVVTNAVANSAAIKKKATAPDRKKRS